jgi:hypothetical protein
MFKEKRRIEKDVKKLATSHKGWGEKKASSCKFQFHSTNAMGDKILQIHILPDLLKKSLKL